MFEKVKDMYLVVGGMMKNLETESRLREIMNVKMVDKEFIL